LKQRPQPFAIRRAVYDRAVRRIGPTATLLEWDDHIPPFKEVHNEALKAKKYLDALSADAGQSAAPQPVEASL